jgi:hypothetical protein
MRNIGFFDYAPPNQQTRSNYGRSFGFFLASLDFWLLFAGSG